MYQPIQEQLKGQGIKSRILAPAKLKTFNEDGTSTTYGNPVTAANLLEDKELYRADQGRKVEDQC